MLLCSLFSENAVCERVNDCLCPFLFFFHPVTSETHAKHFVSQLSVTEHQRSDAGTYTRWSCCGGGGVGARGGVRGADAGGAAGGGAVHAAARPAGRHDHEPDVDHGGLHVPARQVCAGPRGAVQARRVLCARARAARRPAGGHHGRGLHGRADAAHRVQPLRQAPRAVEGAARPRRRDPL